MHSSGFNANFDTFGAYICNDSAWDAGASVVSTLSDRRVLFRLRRGRRLHRGGVFGVSVCTSSMYACSMAFRLKLLRRIQKARRGIAQRLFVTSSISLFHHGK